MDYKEAPYDELATTGLSADYVARETKRAVAGVAGEVKIYPGIDIDVPTLIIDGQGDGKAHQAGRCAPFYSGRDRRGR